MPTPTLGFLATVAWQHVAFNMLLVASQNKATSPEEKKINEKFEMCKSR